MVAMVNNTAMNIGVQVSFPISVFLMLLISECIYFLTIASYKGKMFISFYFLDSPFN